MRKDHTVRLLNKLKHPLQFNMLCFFSEKILPGSCGKLTGEPVACTVAPKCTDIEEKQTPSPQHGH